MRRLTIVTLAIVAGGCGGGPKPPDRPAASATAPAYPRSHFGDEALTKLAAHFEQWAKEQRADDKAVFGRVEVLPLTETILPYGIGSYQKEVRLPIILTTGPGWALMKPAEREALATKVFRHAADQLRELKHEPALLPTLTIQTAQGMELAWINFADEGRKHLHGEDD